MAAPPGEALGNQRRRRGQIGETHIRAVADNYVAIFALQRRTGNDPGLAPLAPSVDPGRDRTQPRRAIRIAERNAGVHPGDVLRRMQRVAFLELPAEPMRQSDADGGLAGAQDTPMTTAMSTL